MRHQYEQEQQNYQQHRHQQYQKDNNNKQKNDKSSKVDYKMQSMKTNQHYLTQTYFFLFMIIIISMINNSIKAYDYNIVVSVGIYWLGTMNPILYKMYYWYVIMILTIVADGIMIGLLVGKVSVFSSVVFPAMEIVFKILIIVIQALRWVKQSKQQAKKRPLQDAVKLKSQQPTKKQLLQARNQYLTSKKSRAFDPRTYYNPKLNTQTPQQRQQEYNNNQVYKQFEQLQYESQSSDDRRRKK